MAPEPEEPTYDDITIELQMQQFFDEWHYRVLHSGIAYEMDRSECVLKALDMFVMHGIPLEQDEKLQLAEMEDEAHMVRIIVAKMPLNIRKTFEHFALQLQLVVSTATRVRHALEESSPEEVARVMGDADSGIGQQVLKQAVTEACIEVGALGEKRDSWAKNMETRMNRLKGCADDSDNCKSQLEALSASLQKFGQEQNEKAKNVLLRMASGSDTATKKAIVRAWLGYSLKVKLEADIHQKFRKQIEDCEQKLVQYRMEKVGGVRSMMQRKGAADNAEWLAIVIGRWHDDIMKTKEEAELAGHNALLKEKLANITQAQNENTKKVMARMSMGSDQQLLTMTFQAMVTSFNMYKNNKEFEDKVRESEAALADYMSQKSEEAKKVMNRMMASTESGLIANVMTKWVMMYLEEKKQREYGDVIGGADGKLGMLKTRQKKAAKGVTERANELEQENLMASVFLQWAVESKSEKMVKHYSGKMDAKKNQLAAVQSMFSSFAVQLEQGMKSSPRR